jgi:hypothetical protein
VALAPVTTVARYGFAGHSDSPRFVTNTAGTVIDYAIGLPGNTTLVHSPSGMVYSHANVHGDAVTVTNGSSGNGTWTGYSGPYGEQATATTPSNTNLAGTNWGWHGDQKRVTDRGYVHMGARLYTPPTVVSSQSTRSKAAARMTTCMSAATQFRQRMCPAGAGGTR